MAFIPQPMIGIGMGVGVAGVGGGGGGGGEDGVPPEIAVNAVNFDGTNDWLSRGAGFTGATDNKFALVSFWFNLKGGDGAGQLMFHSDVGFVQVRRDAANTITFFLFDPAAIALWQGTTTNTFLAAGGWVNFLFSVDTTTGVSTRKLYINDALETITGEVKNAGNIDWTRLDWSIGASAITGVSKVNADYAEFYMTNEFLDLDVVSNRRKFISAGGKPVDLETDGSGPTGTVPLVYLSGPTVSWRTNDGSGGGFTENGALTDGASSPSD